MRRWILLVVLLAVLASGFAWYSLGAGTSLAALRAKLLGNSTTTFRTALVERGDLLATISATGTIEPEEVVDVGAQVAGIIKSFGRDSRDATKSIDYGSPVEEGTVLVQIDDSIYRAQVNQAKANLERAGAELLQSKTKLDLSQRDSVRTQSLRGRNAVSDADLDKVHADFEIAQAAVAASVAAVAQGKALLELAEINLVYTTIKSPVKGVIIDRRVNAGQTVVASLNAPSLFLIAKDLKRLQIWASVNEADIGQIHPRGSDRSGQMVRFTVDAYPDAAFHGEVAQIRLNATMTQNVVTYTVVVDTDNSNGKLLPYQTANLHFEADRREGVLFVANTALRWRPRSDQVTPEARKNFVKTSSRSSVDSGPKAARGEQQPHDRGVLWVADGALVRPVEVQTGLTDGSMTEITSGDVQEEMEVVVGEVQSKNAEGTTNPFTPKMFGGGRPQQ